MPCLEKNLAIQPANSEGWWCEVHSLLAVRKVRIYTANLSSKTDFLVRGLI